MTPATLTTKAIIRSGIRIPFRGPWCQPRGTSAWTRGRPHGTPGSASRRLGSPGRRGGWGSACHLGAESPGTGRRASCPRLAVYVLVVIAFLLTTTNGDNDRPIISYWSRGVCPPELQAFLHPANKPPALPTLASRRCCSPIFRERRVAEPVSPSRSGNGQSRPVTEHRPPAWGQ